MADDPGVQQDPDPPRGEQATSASPASRRDPAEGAAQAEELEELVLPSSEVPRLEPLVSGTALTDGARNYRIGEFLETRAGVNRYRALVVHDEGNRPLLLEEAATAEAFDHRRRLLEGIQYPMLPRFLGCFEHDSRAYLATEWIEGETLEEALQRGMALEEVLRVLVQVTQALRKIHEAGWVHFAVAPGNVVLGRPARLANFDWVLPKGATRSSGLLLAGYSAPEQTGATEADPLADIFSIGAILYRTVTGTVLPETGPQWLAIRDQVKMPGVPQILARSLGAQGERYSTADELLRALVDLQRQISIRVSGYEVIARTTIGLEPTRMVNEDSFTYLTAAVAAEGQVTPVLLLCVADGLGGMEAGEIASRAAVETVHREIREKLGSLPSLSPEEQAKLNDALVRAANAAVCNACEGKDAGTTLSSVLALGDRLTVGHVGDSRIYLVHRGEIRQLSEDHTLVAIKVKSGEITPEQARGHPDSNKVLRSLGSMRTLPDYYVFTLDKSFGRLALELEPDDVLLLCSDGVWGQVEDGELLAAVIGSPDHRYASNVILQKVLERGAPDNATVLLARAY